MSGSVSGRRLSWIQGSAVGTKGREMVGSTGSRQKRGVLFIKNLTTIIKPVKRWTPFSYHHVLMVLSSVSVGWTLGTLSPWQPLVVTVLGMPSGGRGPGKLQMAGCLVL